ncbi:hypothetical protein AMJ96_CH01609 [Rhizobium sp. N113]|nr:hypothetical protein AMJ96_CH01609 [Rhizobium sp. N113]
MWLTGTTGAVFRSCAALPEAVGTYLHDGGTPSGHGFSDLSPHREPNYLFAVSFVSRRRTAMSFEPESLSYDQLASVQAAVFCDALLPPSYC